METPPAQTIIHAVRMVIIFIAYTLFCIVIDPDKTAALITIELCNI